MKKITITTVISVTLLFIITSTSLNATTNVSARENSNTFLSSFENSVIDLIGSDSYKKDEDGDGVKDKKDECPGTPKDVVVDEKGCPVDNDKDGVADFLDKCPKTVGLVGLNGCPDKDNDGVSDNDDNCAEVPGLARFMGCPDSDEDGIEDAKDKCPNAKGSDLFKGCPDTDADGVEDAMDKCANSVKGVKVDATGCVADSDRDGIADVDDKCPDTQKGIKVDMKGCAADTDGDGIIDTNDKCPTTKAEGTSNGCPVVKPDVKKRLDFAARGTNFESGKATLTVSSYDMLDEVASILKEKDYSDYFLRIGGHTDNVGGDDTNLQLSQARVDAVKAYLLSKGIPASRMEATGYGESKPIASNDTSDGRGKNRRVELELFVK